jgi:zinc protease
MTWIATMRSSSRPFLSSSVLVLAALCGAGCASTKPPPTTIQSAPALPRDPPRPEGPVVVRTVEQRAPNDPIVNLRLVFESGSREDPAGKEGLTSLTGALLTEATAQLSASELRDALFPWAAELWVSGDKETTVIGARVHRDHAAAFTDVLLDVLLHPRFDPQDFERLREERVSYLERTLRTGNDEALQREALEVLLYDAATLTGGKEPAVRHPYHHTPEGTVAGLKAITLDDVRAQWKRVLTRDRLLLGIAGGYTDDVLAKLKTGIEQLPATGPARTALPPVQARAATELVVVEKPSAGTAISLGFPIELDRTSPDYAAMKLAEMWFGEHRNMIGWLFHAMREVRGLNYGDYAYVEHFQQDGWGTNEALNIGRRQQYFSLWIRPVEHKNRLFALRAAVYELSRFAERGIPDDASFRRLQSFALGYGRAKQQDRMRRLGYALDDVFYPSLLPRDALLAKYATLTRDDVNRAIKKYLHADKLAIVVVTEDAQPFVRDLLQKTPATIAYPGKVPPEILEEDKLIAAYDLGLAPERVHVVSPNALFGK